MRLRDIEILQAIHSGQLKITPTPAVEKITGVTLDVHLGNEFRTLHCSDQECLNLALVGEAQKTRMKKLVSPPVVLEPGALFTLHPGQFALGITLESFELPDDLVGWLDGRSSLARLGLMVHMTAHRLDPGMRGHMVLEFFNAGPVPLGLSEGLTIGAISYERLIGPVQYPYHKKPSAKYLNQAGATPSRMYLES